MPMMKSSKKVTSVAPAFHFQQPLPLKKDSAINKNRIDPMM